MGEVKELDKELFDSSSNRLDTLLILRGFACLMVVINHVHPPRNSIIYKGYDLSWLIFSHASVAVWIFFCLSGYLMGKAFYTGRYAADVTGVKNFWWNRILRIFPLYYFSTLILVLFIAPEVLKIENWGYLLRVLTFTYDFSLPIKFNPAVWSLATEVQFYICFPFIFNYLRFRLFKRSQIISALIIVVSSGFILRLIVWIVFNNEIHDNALYYIKYWYNPLIMNLDIFLCGFLVNAWIKCHIKTDSEEKKFEKLTKKFRFTTYSPKLISVVLLVLLYLFASHHIYHQELWGLVRNTNGIRTSTTFFILPPLTALIASFFIFAFETEAYQEFGKNERLSFGSILRNPLRSLEIFGILSYGVYIWHQPIIAKITPIFTSNIPIEAFYARLIAALSLSTLLAAVTYYSVELPAARWKIYR